MKLNAIESPPRSPPYGRHSSQYVCHVSEVCTGRFCLCLLGYIPDLGCTPALLSAVDVTGVYPIRKQNQLKLGPLQPIRELGTLGPFSPPLKAHSTYHTTSLG